MSDKTKTSPDSSETVTEKQPSSTKGISRRGFLKGAGLSAAGTALLEGVQSLGKETATVSSRGIKEYGPNPSSIMLTVNGKEHSLTVEPRTTLADALRLQLGLTGTKVICDRGSCSGCTVLLDKVPVNSCTTLAIDAVGRRVTTIEGISTEGHLHPIQAAFIKHDALQCGFCTPGMVMSCVALLEQNPRPTEDDVRQAVSGNLCRCGTYPKIFSATLDAADTIRRA